MTDQNKYTTINYGEYLQLDKLLDAQHPRSKALGEPAHDEMLFIITHQAYELWFKQVIHELDSAMAMFNTNLVDAHSVGTIVARLRRVVEIMKLMVQQIGVLETMTPLDFLDFRDYLFPASGFQSYQFRVVETMLGLQSAKRITYNQCKYSSVFSEEKQVELDVLEAEQSIFTEVELWLERTPFLKLKDFNFLEQYKATVEKMIKKEQKNINAAAYLSDQEKEMRLKMVGSTDTYFQSVLDPKKHEELRAEGKLRLSYGATVAALFINLYRDEPILHGPFNLLVCLSEIDEQLTNWRYRHSQMVFRMLGSKVGTGGSSGHDYLLETAQKHHIYSDFQSVSTMLIPRSELMELPGEVKKQLGFYFSNQKK